METKLEVKETSRQKVIWARRAMFWLALVGLFAATYLLYTYVTGTDLRCGPLHGCEIVKNSPWAHWFGIPTPAFGVAFYLLVIAISVYRAYAPHKRVKLMRILMLFAAWAGFLESIYLTMVQRFVLHAFCTWCLVSAAAATGIFVFVWLDRKPEVSAGVSLKELKIVFVSFLVALLIGGGAMYLLLRPVAPKTVQLDLTQGTPEKLYVPTSQSTTTAVATTSSDSEARDKAQATGKESTTTVVDKTSTAMDSAPEDATQYPVIASSTPIEGPMTAKVTLVEFMDFQCPACGLYYQLVIKPLRDKYQGRIKFAARHFPLPDLHPQALGASIAGVCAQRQGKFFAFYDTLYQNQQALARTDLERYAESLGMDMGKFRSCLEDPSAKEQIIYDYNAGRSFGITGTPTLIINDALIEGTPNLEALSQLIDERL